MLSVTTSVYVYVYIRFNNQPGDRYRESIALSHRSTGLQYKREREREIAIANELLQIRIDRHRPDALVINRETGET